MTKLARIIPLIAGLALQYGAAQTASLAPASSVDEALRNGGEAMRVGRFDEAEKWFRRAASANPDNPDAQMALGIAELRMGKPEPASDALQRAVQLRPDMEASSLFLGIAYAQMHRVTDAVTALQRAMTLDPRDAQAAMWLGVVELQDGHPEKATAPLDRAAELAPNDLNVLEYRGKAHTDVAYASYARMAAIDQQSWHVHRVQGQMFDQQSRYTEAIAEFKEAIKQAPQNSDLYEELAAVYRKSGAMELAQQAYAKELELSPNNPVAIFNLGKIDIETNRTAEGMQLLHRVAANYQGAPAIDFYLGLGALDEGKTSEAVEQLERARGQHPEAELAQRIEFQLARAYRKLGKTAEANRAAQEYARLREQNSKLNPHALAAISAGFGASELPTAKSENKQ